MKIYIVWIVLAVLMVTGSLIEGLVAGLPQHWVQLNGFVTIVSAMGFIILTLKRSIDFQS